MIHAIAFGKTLIRCRKWFNLSQNDVAQLLGVTNQAVSKWELGNSTPNITILSMLSEIFFVDIKTLIEFDEETENKIQREIKNANYFIKRDQTLFPITSNLTKSFFFNCYANDLKLKQVKTYQCVYANSKFNNILINESQLNATNFTNCKFIKINIENSSLTYMRFIMNLATYDLKSCDINNCIFNNETVKSARFINCHSLKCSYNKSFFSKCSFNKTSLVQSIFSSASFHECDFIQTSWKNNIYNKCSFVDCVFDKHTINELNKSNVKIIRPIIK